MAIFGNRCGCKYSNEVFVGRESGEEKLSNPAMILKIQAVYINVASILALQYFSFVVSCPTRDIRRLFG